MNAIMMAWQRGVGAVVGMATCMGIASLPVSVLELGLDDGEVAVPRGVHIAAQHRRQEAQRPVGPHLGSHDDARPGARRGDLSLGADVQPG